MVATAGYIRFITTAIIQQNLDLNFIEFLAHNNTVAFITHGGMLSKIEAIYFGVPLLGIPVLGDQFMNVADAVHDGIAVSVDINKLNELLFDEALNNILNNSR